VVGSKHRKNPWHRGYGCGVASGLKISTCTCTCVTCDHDTAVLPIPMLHPNWDPLHICITN
jgi:hypothetical protein